MIKNKELENTQEPYDTRLEMAHNYIIDLTENNKSKPSGSQTADENLLAIANNDKKQKFNQ